MALLDKKKQDWLDAHKNENVFELCDKGAFKTDLNWASTHKLAKDTNEYRQAKATQDAYNKDVSEREDLFRLKLGRDHHMEEFPDELHDTIYSMAWDRGHSAGLNEVAVCYYDIVDQLKSVYQMGFDKGKGGK